MKGVVPEILSDTVQKSLIPPLDMNSAVAEIGTLDYFFDKMPPGATIVLTILVTQFSPTAWGRDQMV